MKVIKLYLFSIVIWAIMIYGTAYLFNEKIKENGWLDMPKSKKNPFVIIVLGSVIPIIRALFFLVVIIMIGMTREKFEEITKESKDESN